MPTIKDDPKNLEVQLIRCERLGIQPTARAREIGLIRAELIGSNREGLIAYASTNTVSTELKRNLILDGSIRAFAVRTLLLSAFSTVYNGVRLAGTNKVVVPFFPLDTTASHDWNPAEGYDTFGNTNADGKEVTVDQRKYQGLSVTSSEIARQPFLNTAESAMLKANQLGLDVVNDVLSIITAADYGEAVHTEQATAFDSDDVIKLKGAADAANWPVPGRSLVLNSEYDLALLKDSAVKSAMAFGDSAPIREGRILRIGGFDYYPDARIPDNSEGLEGFIVSRGAILCAFSPIEPKAEVMQQLADYRIVVEPQTGVALEYRRFGSAQMDTGYEIIEANYGYDLGNTAALNRIVTPS